MDDGYKKAQRYIQQALADESVYLDLSRLKLTTVPSQIGQLTGLQSLDLSINQLTAIPPEIGQLMGLQWLDLSRNQLIVVPPEIGQLTGLQTLDLSYNELAVVPPEIVQLTGLQSLNLSRNELTAVPPEIVQLTGLQTLDLSYNKLPAVPEILIQISDLKHLDLHNNKIPFPLYKILEAKFIRAESLNLSGNQLTIVPPEIVQLTGLQSLDLSYNELTAVPPEIVQLTELQGLDLSRNSLTILPKWLINMAGLKALVVQDNPIVQPPPELLGKSITATAWIKFSKEASVNLEVIRRYYAQLEKEGEATIYEAKLLLIGEGGAGKTSLARKLIDATNPLPPPDDSTKGIDVHPWNFPLPQPSPSPEPVEGKGKGENSSGFDELSRRYTANIWDFGGQSIYKNTHQFFLSKRSVYVLLTDTRRESDFYDWLRMQEAFGADSPILILKNQNRHHGNQCIIENLPQLQERFPNMQEIIQLDLSGVPDKEAEAWADFLRYLQRHLLNLDHIGKPIPRTWVAARNALNEDTRNSISRDQYLALCTEKGISDPADALQLSQFLHDIGDILHYQTDPGPLANLIILDPTWALDAVYRILDNKQISDAWGQFSYHQLCALWDEPSYANHQDQLLALMRRFQLCYQLPQKRGHYIAPQMLKPQVSDYNWEAYPDDLQLRYHYPNFMPRGILSRAVVVLHEYIEAQQLVWRSGAILKNKHARAELLELRGEKEIRIRISGSRRLDFLMQIVQMLDKLHEGFSSKLNYEKRVPCRCERCIQPKNKPHFFDLEYLRYRLASPKQSKWVVECRYKPFYDIHVRDLIDDAVLQMNLRGDGMYVGGDYIHVGGDISNVRGMGIGRKSSGTASS